MSTPIVSIAQMRQWEAATWAAGRTETEVISRVGHIVTARARQLTRPGDLILVLAGKGHNGDDARHAAQNLTDREVFSINVTDPALALQEFRSELTLPPALIIDGLFGLGLNRPLSPEWIAVIEAINATGIPVLAIDLPSGINADTGEAMGAAVRAAVTLTLGAPKTGLLAAHAWSSVGRLELAPDIGLLHHDFDTELRWTLGSDFAGFPPSAPPILIRDPTAMSASWRAAAATTAPPSSPSAPPSAPAQASSPPWSQKASTSPSPANPKPP